jgi:FtsP/CotA-like multicopper oxidase with cupredoxin domain
MFIIDDTNPVQNSLPHTYGVDDLPLIFQDTPFGQLNGNGGGGQGTTLVNGTISPTITTSHSRLRLRLLNASNQRFYNFGFANNQTFYQVASDGGLLPAPVTMSRLQLGPAERAEIIIDLNTSQPMLLQTFGGNGGGRGGNNFQNNTLLSITSTGAAAKLGALPSQLNSIERLQPGSAIQTRDMVLNGNDRNPTINNQSMTSMADMMNMSNVLKVKLGTTEVWNLINRSGDTHAFHVHDIQFQLLDRNGTTPAANEAGLKDTVVVRPRETVRIIMRFTDFADPNTPYIFHCHVLEHEDNGMMGQFVVV